MEKIRTYDLAGFSKATKALHQASTIFSSEGMSLRGSARGDIKARQNHALDLQERLSTVHKRWVDAKLTPLVNYLQKDALTEGKRNELMSLLEERYKEGLGSTVKMVIKAASQPVSTQDIVAAYTGSFITMLRMCERFSVPPKTAIMLAQRSYLLDGVSFARLFREYEDTPNDVIIHAAAHTPSDPRGFLEKYTSAMERLTGHSEFLDVDPKLISFAARNAPTDPEGYLRQFKETFAQLRRRRVYSSLSDASIQRAIRNNPTDPEGYLYRQLKKRRRDIFP